MIECGPLAGVVSVDVATLADDGIITVCVTDLAVVGLVTVGVTDLADTGMAFPTYPAGAVTVGVTGLADVVDVPKCVGGDIRWND